MKVFHGTILTVDEKDSVAEWLAEDGGRILYVGNNIPEGYLKMADERIELEEGQVLCPTFVDSHQHFASFATFHAGLNVMDAESNEQILEMAAEFVKNSKSKTIIAFGASPYSVKEGKLVSREQLDSVCPDKPFFFVKYDGHACVVNSALLKKVDKKVKNLRGYHPDTGEMNQEAFFAVSDYITNSISVPQLIRNMSAAVDYEARKGIGMIHTVSGVGFPMNLDIDIERWFADTLTSGPQIRVFPQSMDVDVALKRGLPRIGGCFACALDGCFGSKDAALNAPYEGTESDTGVLYYTDEQVTEFCKAANRAGLQIEMHAIGDAAFDQATRCLKAALVDYPRKDHRHTIIHACLPTEEGIKICRRYNILLAMQTAFIDWKQEPGVYLESILGSRAAALNPMRMLWDEDIPISAGSDAPCTDPDPIAWMDHAFNNADAPEQSLTPQEALRMCTYNGYYTTFDEKNYGSLVPGKHSNMVLLSADPYTIPKEEIGNIRVLKTYFDGSEYQPQDIGVLEILKNRNPFKKPDLSYFKKGAASVIERNS